MAKKKSFGLDDVLTIENGAEEREYYASLQRAINSGSAWSLQGSYGRTMMDALSAGRCVLGTAPAFDYWGNRIPSRTEVQDGTKGSMGFVAENSGPDWSAWIASL